MLSENRPNAYELWGATQEAEEQPTSGSACFLSQDQFSPYQYIFPLILHEIFKVYYQVFELQTLTLLKSSFCFLNFWRNPSKFFCVLSEHTEVVNDVMHTI